MVIQCVLRNMGWKERDDGFLQVITRVYPKVSGLSR